MSGGLEPEEGDTSKHTYLIFPPSLFRKEMLHAIKFIMLCLAALVTMQHEDEERIFPRLDYCRIDLIDLHVWCICENTVKKGEGGKGKMFICYQLMNNKFTNIVLLNRN